MSNADGSETMEVEVYEQKGISPIEITFSNGDDNLLRDKINEIIARIG